MATIRKEIIVTGYNRLQIGSRVRSRELITIHSERIKLPDPQRLVHLQFRRFAGCPVCNLHLHSIVQRHKEIVAAALDEVVVFHSTRDALLPFCDGLPFPIVADPEKRLYKEFGAESGPRALLDPRAWGPILRGVLRSALVALRKQEPVPTLNLEGGRFGLPADFLIAPDSRILARHYGSHAYDQWSVDEILTLAYSLLPCLPLNSAEAGAVSGDIAFDWS